jgi:hypothetical protein
MRTCGPHHRHLILPLGPQQNPQLAARAADPRPHQQPRRDAEGLLAGGGRPSPASAAAAAAAAAASLAVAAAAAASLAAGAAAAAARIIRAGVNATHRQLAGARRGTCAVGSATLKGPPSMARHRQRQAPAHSPRSRAGAACRLACGSGGAGAGAGAAPRAPRAPRRAARAASSAARPPAVRGLTRQRGRASRRAPTVRRRQAGEVCRRDVRSGGGGGSPPAHSP